MKPSQIVSLLLSLFIVTPIWFYLVYTILVAIHPDRLVWFLFEVYIPANILSRIIGEIAYSKTK